MGNVEFGIGYLTTSACAAKGLTTSALAKNAPSQNIVAGFIRFSLGFVATFVSPSPRLRGDGSGEGDYRRNCYQLTDLYPSPGSLRDPTSPRKRGEVNRSARSPIESKRSSAGDDALTGERPLRPRRPPHPGNCCPK